MSEFDEELIRELVGEVEELAAMLAPTGEGPLSDFRVAFRYLHALRQRALFADLNDFAAMLADAEALLDGLQLGTLRATPERLELLASFGTALSGATSRLRQGLAPLVEDFDAVRGGVIESMSLGSARGGAVLRDIVMPGDLVDAPRTSRRAAAGGLDAVFGADLIEKFSAESEEHLEIIEATLLKLERGSAEREEIEEAFRGMHSLKGNCGLIGLADLEQVTHVLESALLNWKEGRSEPTPEKVTVVLDVLDVVRGALSNLGTDGGRISQKAAIITRLKSLDANGAATAPRDERPVTPGAAATESEGAGPKRAGDEKASAATSIRVDTKKLDELMNLVGELIVAETTVTHNPDLEGYELPSFQRAALNLNRIIRTLQDVAMQARMVPLEANFRKMIRLVRDVAGKQKKQVELELVGEDTEVDKSVIETVADPLVHLVRNAVDHGLEAPEERAAAGKPPVGRLRLEARHQGGEVWISLSDDGRGIDPEKILASAIKKGLADPAKSYGRAEILSFIFAPGFSTAAKLTDISGRGVGMDVVKSNLEKVNGRIEIETAVGEGTTFTLRIPLTLAIIEGMLIRSAGCHYTIPLLAIRESVRANEENVTRTSDGQELLRLREEHHRIVKLPSASDSPSSSVEEGILVVVESGPEVACLLVDEVVGQRQTVIKPLPDYLREVPSLSGCTILPNGEVSLILDVDALLKASTAEEAA